jgi:hypothetical protein
MMRPLLGAILRMFPEFGNREIRGNEQWMGVKGRAEKLSTINADEY